MAKHELNPSPPRWADFLLRWVCPADLQEELQGDLHEQFIVDCDQIGRPAARRRYIIEVLKFARPYFLKRKLRSPGKPLRYPSPFFANPEMIHNYLKIAWRNVISHKGYSAIHIFGLAFSMTVAILVGVWVHNETSFNKSHQKLRSNCAGMATCNHQRPAVCRLPYNPYHLAELIRNNYGSDFNHVQMGTFTSDHILSYESNKFVRKGSFMESEVPENAYPDNGLWQQDCLDRSLFCTCFSILRGRFIWRDRSGR